MLVGPGGLASHPVGLSSWRPFAPRLELRAIIPGNWPVGRSGRTGGTGLIRARSAHALARRRRRCCCGGGFSSSESAQAAQFREASVRGCECVRAPALLPPRGREPTACFATAHVDAAAEWGVSHTTHNTHRSPRQTTPSAGKTTGSPLRPQSRARSDRLASLRGLDSGQCTMGKGRVFASNGLSICTRLNVLECNARTLAKFKVKCALCTIY